MMNDWASSMDPEALRKKLDELNKEAAKAVEDKETSAPASPEAPKAAGEAGGFFGVGMAMALSQVQAMAQNGMLEKQEKFTTSGSFSSEQAARFGGPTDNIPKQQLDALTDIKKSVKRTADKRGGVATP